MGMRYPLRGAAEIKTIFSDHNDDAAAVYPDHDIVTRHFDGPLTIGEFVSAFADGADVHGGLPTYLRLTVRGDATKLRKLIAEKKRSAHAGHRTSH